MTLLTRLAAILLPGMAWAQEAVSLGDLQARVKTGETLYVTDATGASFKGKFADLSGGSLGLTYKGSRKEFRALDIREIRRREPDSRSNGALIGLAAGIGAGLLSIPVSCGTNDKECGTIVGLVFVPIGAAAGAVTGALIDGMIARSTTVYQGPASQPRAAIFIVPVVDRQRKGFALSIRF